MLNLKRTNHAVLIDNRPSFIGMLMVAQNFITWGEPSKEAIHLLIRERGRLAGGKKLTDDYAKKVGFACLDELVDALYDCKIEYWNLPNIQPYFRLHPPSSGFKGKIKKPCSMGGELGYRGEKINELLERMI